MTFTFGADINARLADFRALDVSAMPDLCDLLEAGTVVVNPDGSTSQGTITIPNLPCRLTTGPMAVELLIAMGLTNVANSILHIPLGTPVSPRDQVRYRGQVYEVMGTDSGASYATSTAIALKKIN